MTSLSCLRFQLLLHPDEAALSRGIVISGVTGSGKTAIVEQLVALSCHGDGQTSIVDDSQAGAAGAANGQQQSDLPSYDSLRNLSDQVVAYHYCQADYNITCMLADYVHNLAAQLVQAPHLTPYRDYLVQNPSLQMALCIKECIRNPSEAFLRGVVEPLVHLEQSGRLGHEIVIVVVDSLNEAEFHRPDYGETLATFLHKHFKFLPLWIKVIVTVRTALLDVAKLFPYHQICLNRQQAQDSISRDLGEYVKVRVDNSERLCGNISGVQGHSGHSHLLKFSTHLMTLSQGSFLFVKLVLDLIESGHLVVKSSNYKLLPQNLAEVFLLMFNLKFPSIRSFERLCPILNICLASLYPLSAVEVMEALNSSFIDQFVTWDEFQARLDVIRPFLVMRKDATYMFFHPAFREWLYRRDEVDHIKFLCDLR